MAMTDQQKLRVAIVGTGAAIVTALLLCCFPRGCKRGCNDCDKPVVEPKKDTVYVIKKDYHVGGDMINVEGDNNDVNFTKGNGNNVSSRNSGTQTWERATRPQPKKVVKKTVVQPEPVIEPQPEPKPEPKPEYKREVHISGKVMIPCNGR